MMMMEKMGSFVCCFIAFRFFGGRLSGCWGEMWEMWEMWEMCGCVWIGGGAEVGGEGRKEGRKEGRMGG